MGWAYPQYKELRKTLATKKLNSVGLIGILFMCMWHECTHNQWAVLYTHNSSKRGKISLSTSIFVCLHSAEETNLFDDFIADWFHTCGSSVVQVFNHQSHIGNLFAVSQIWLYIYSSKKGFCNKSHESHLLCHWFSIRCSPIWSVWTIVLQLLSHRIYVWLVFLPTQKKNNRK